MKTLICIMLLCSAAFAGVKDGETYVALDGTVVTVAVSGGTHGDYQTSVGTSKKVSGTPSVTDVGGVEETPKMYDGKKTFRVNRGRLQQLDEKGRWKTLKPGDDEMVGTLPYHVPIPAPDDKPDGDTPPDLEKDPPPVV